MSKLAPIHWARFDKFLLAVGCQLVRERGDHRVYQRPGLIRPVIVPRDTQLLSNFSKKCEAENYPTTNHSGFPSTRIGKIGRAQ